MKVSIVIPAYNAEKFIDQCLKSVMKVDYSDFEIIVVDDGSKDNTSEIVKNFPVKLIKLEENTGAATARNIGIKNARGEVVVFTDADCIVQRRWIKDLVRTFKEDKEIVGVNGVYKTYNKRSSLARFVGYDMAFRFKRMPKYISTLGTYNCALYKRILEQEKFNERQKGIFWEDAELGHVISRKHKIKLNLNSYVYHHHPSTFKDYFKKQGMRATGQMILMRRGGKTDNYVGVPSLVQIPLTLFFFVSIVFAFFIPIFFLSALAFLGLIISNLAFLNFISKKENFAFLIISVCFILVRNTAWIFGVFRGLFYPKN